MAFSFGPNAMDLSLRRLVAGAQGVDLSDLWTLAALVSVIWLVYRVLLVYRKPTEELEEILGIDIPPIPDVTLSSIASDSVVLYWKTPENYYTPLSVAVQVNGVQASFTRTEATIKVTRLQPGHCYSIRVVTTNAAGNPSYSNVIQLQTPPREGHTSAKLLSSFDHAYPKRAGSRRVSQPLGEKAHSPGGQARASTTQQDDSQKKLQRQLDDLRRDVEEAESQLKEDRVEAEAQISHLTSQRDALKHQVDEREKESTELRKRVADMEKAAKNSQRKKSERERRVKEKTDQRQKMKEDMVRWEAESLKITEELEGVETSKAEIRELHDTKLQESQQSFETVQAEVAKLEEDLRDMGIKVRKLEEEREKADKKQNEEEKQAELRQQEEAEAHETKVHEYQHHYHALWRLNAEANARLQDASEQLQHFLDLRNREPSKFSPIPGLDYPVNAFQQSRRVQRGPMALNRPGHPTYSNSANPSPTFGTAFPFPPLGAALRSGGQGLSTSDVHQLSAVTPLLSPGSDVLLPSDLLGDEDDPNMVIRTSSGRPRFGSIPHIYRPPSRTSAGAQDPQSPHSIDSKSPSLVSSPHESRSNVAHIYGDDETQSLGSVNSPFSATTADSNPGGSRKISNILWGFNRQRDKAPLSELPALGTLKSKETQSFPSNLDESPDVAPSGGRKGASIWSPMTGPFNFLNRNAGKNGEAEMMPSGPTRKGRRGLLGSKIDRSDPLMGSSRPSSTYSFDQVISQPVIEGQYGWKTPDSSRPRGSTLAGPWSHNQSRRASIAHGSTSNLSIGSTPLDPAGDYPSPYNFGAKATPAPIGTERFHIGKRSNTPKLNPNAPSFTTRLFNRGDSKKPKAEKGGDVAAAVAAEKDKEKTEKSLDAYSKSSSPPVSRLSHEAPSITTSASIGESHDSLEPTTSASHSDGAGPTSGSAPKESLMQRITRKSSTTKFSVPWSNRSGKGGATRKEPSTPGDLDEDGDSDYLARGGVAESATSTPPQPDRGVGRGSLSWSRVMGKGRKRSELNMSDAGERSSEAGGETTEDDG